MGRQQQHQNNNHQFGFGQTMQELFDDCKRGQTQRVQSWIAQKGKKQRSPLSFLRSSNGISSMPASGWLCGLRQPSTSHTLLHLVALNGHGELARFLVQKDAQLVRVRDKKGCLPLHLAAWNGHSTILEILLTEEPDIINSADNAKQTALHLATLNGHGQSVRFLLQHHIDARLRNAHQECALDIAVRTGKANICRLLLLHCTDFALQCASDCCVSPNSSKYPYPAYPLHIAARFGHEECLLALLENGFDPNYLEKEGTALHAAIKQGQVGMAKILMEKGADKSIKDSEGRTPLELVNRKLAEKDVKEGERNLAKWQKCRMSILATDRNGNDEKIQNNTMNWQSLMPNGGGREDRSWQRRHQNAAAPIPSPRSTIDRTNPISLTQQNGCCANIQSQRSKLSPQSNSSSSSHSPSSPSPCCAYQPLPQQNGLANNEQKTTMPPTNYQNVSKGGFIYDNAPSPNGSSAQKKWRHNCGGMEMPLSPTMRSKSTFPSKTSTLRVCLSKPVSPVRYGHQFPVISDHKCKSPNEMDKLMRMGSEELLGIDISNFFNSPCSTFERMGNSPPNSFPLNGKKEGMINSAAPLAKAEELTTSACTTEPNTPERRIKASTNKSESQEHCSGDEGEIRSLPVASCNSIVTLAISPSSSSSGGDGSIPPLISKFSPTPPNHSPNRNNSREVPASLPNKFPSSSSPTLSVNLSNAFPQPMRYNSQAKPPLQQGQKADDAIIHVNQMEAEGGKFGEGNSRKEMEFDGEEIRWKEIDDLLKSFQRESFYGPSQNQNGQITNPTSVGLTNGIASPKLANSSNTNGHSHSNSPPPSPCSSLLIVIWLREEIGLKETVASQIGPILFGNGFDRVEFMKGALNTKLMGEMGIERKCQLRICRHLNDSELQECIPMAADFEFVSDWLNSLHLLDQLGCFSRANLTYSVDLVAANLSRGDLEKMGIIQLGHIARIIRSLELATKSHKMQQSLHSNKKESHSLMENTSNSSSSPHKRDECREQSSANDSKASSTISRSSRAALSPQIDMAELRIKLVEGCAHFTAHYLGVAEISNVEGTEDCRRAMNAAKEKAGHLAHVPHILMEISVLGVNILDEKGKAICYQPISNIQVVCQDELDLNCFAYIFKDGNKDFSHVFCVLTAIIAKEIIMTLGEAFNLAYKIALEKETATF